jgi:hypothetical protein
MKKICFLLTAVVFSLSVQVVGAWEGSTHRAIAEAAYNKLPENVRARLNYTWIIDGSCWPDWYRNDPDPWGRTFPSSGHIQPASRMQAKSWLLMAENRYGENDYDNASLYLGIASHYIADSMCLVHNIGWTDLHYEYEGQGASLILAEPTPIENFDLSEKLAEYYGSAQDTWHRWLSTRDVSIAQEGVDLAATYTYNAWCQALHVQLTYTSGNARTRSIDFRMVALAVLIVLIVASAIGIIHRHRSHQRETFDITFSGCS